MSASTAPVTTSCCPQPTSRATFSAGPVPSAKTVVDASTGSMPETRTARSWRGSGLARTPTIRRGSLSLGRQLAEGQGDVVSVAGRRIVLHRRSPACGGGEATRRMSARLSRSWRNLRPRPLQVRDRRADALDAPTPASYPWRRRARLGCAGQSGGQVGRPWDAMSRPTRRAWTGRAGRAGLAGQVGVRRKRVCVCFRPARSRHAPRLRAAGASQQVRRGSGAPPAHRDEGRGRPGRTERTAAPDTLALGLGAVDGDLVWSCPARPRSHEHFGRSCDAAADDAVAAPILTSGRSSRRRWLCQRRDKPRPRLGWSCRSRSGRRARWARLESTTHNADTSGSHSSSRATCHGVGLLDRPADWFGAARPPSVHRRRVILSRGRRTATR